MLNEPQFTVFHPWIGKHYYDRPLLGKRILIVSSHFVVRQRTQITLNTNPEKSIQKVKNGDVNHLLPLLKGVSHRQISASQQQKNWDSVSYFDYHQCNFSSLVAAELPGMLPLFKDRFQKVLAQLRPEIIAVRKSPFVSDEVLLGATHLEERVELSSRYVLAKFQYPNGSAMAFTMAGRFCYGIWNERIRLAVQRSP